MMHPVCNGYVIWQILAVQWSLVGFLIMNVYANLQVYEGRRHFDGSLLALIEISFDNFVFKSAAAVILHYNFYYSFLKKENYVFVFDFFFIDRKILKEKMWVRKNPASTEII